MMALFYFTGSEIHPISAHDESKRYYRESDAGVHNDFIVEAPNATTALKGALEWLAARADDSVALMPDGLHLHERLYRHAHGHIILQVECD